MTHVSKQNCSVCNSSGLYGCFNTLGEHSVFTDENGSFLILTLSCLALCAAAPTPLAPKAQQTYKVETTLDLLKQKSEPGVQ